ncbi:MAG: sigma-70 family RNA polymerase sigma factor [Planctomycetes bacterium]|nr:sigma-70 family RNA polymerase sigma factor [Planctomycetota bacterium]
MSDVVSDKTGQLVALAKDGDESALGQLCNVYAERVRWIVRLRMGREIRSKFESMDLVQDAFVSALRDLGSFTYRNDGDFLRWLSKIAENRIRDHIDEIHAGKRDIRKEASLEHRTAGGKGSFIGTVGRAGLTTPSMIASKREELDRLEKAMDELTPEHKEVIVLTKIEGLSYVEIGGRLGKSADAVRMLVSRAMASLAGTFERI